MMPKGTSGSLNDWNLVIRLECFPLSYLAATSPKAYLQQFLLPSTSHPAIQKNYRTYQKAKNNLKRQSKHQNQTHTVGMLEFKTPMINMLRALMEKADNIKEQMSNEEKKEKL